MKDVVRFTPLGDLVTIVMGQAPSSKDCNFDGRGTPFVKAGEFGARRPIIREWTTNPLKHARKTDVLLCVVGATCGKLNLGEDCAIGRSVAAIRPEPTKLDQFYLHYFLMTLVDRLRAGSVGAAQTVISKEMIQSVTFPWREVPEQRRIVAILDEAFEGIAIAKANAEKNLQNARELFENYHQSVFSRGGEGWVDYRLGEIASFRNGINFTKQSKGRSVPIIGVKNFQNHLWAPLDDLDSVTLDGGLSELDTLAEGDILSVRSNGNPELIGRCMLVGSLSEPITHSGFTIRIRLHDGNTLPQYVCQFLKSRDVRRTLIDGGNGANIRSLNQGTLSSVVIPLPPIEIQQRIINEIEAMHSKTAYLADIASRKLAALDELKKSLLHQAFTGQL